ncbi:FtsX-like permease family protein [Clostridium niameyense]|uniref:FtsX-like permease family protein n=1 Tax=Clostridium niameyense TaxID=1622073 RepID=A0A6M0RBR4_9CLOT|nr:FtsX-like permease family protein [Clostridium niameyense]NEZ47751.1 FtsX-like permease family protein [Clostridium niameyense]
MYSKIASRNVKRSFKDYAIYFLTLTFAVCIFYTFNSIGAQQAMLKLNKNQAQYVKVMENAMGYISIFVSVILGGLIIYANNFLVKRRKKELGIYMVLGMGKNKISKILFLETFLIGIVSLIAGLVLGITLSQGLSVFTAKLFQVGMSEYKFLVSPLAIQKSILYFGIIFLLVMIFNTVIISKYKLIDLLNAAKKNEKFKVKNPIFSVMIFTFGIISLIVAYYLINKSMLDPKDSRTLISILLGCLGTFFFFFGFSEFIISMIQNSKKLYFKNLNIFVTRQISSKINTNFISMTVICLMLFLTISILSTGIGFKNALEQSLKETTPFDATITIHGVKTPKSVLDKLDLKSTKDEKYAYYTQYMVDFDYKNTLYEYTDSNVRKQFNMLQFNKINAIKISEYNKLRELNGQKPVELTKDEVLVTSNFKSLIPATKKLLTSKKTLRIDNKIFNIKNKKLITNSTANRGIADNIFTIVVNDKFLEGKEVFGSYININYIGHNKEKSEKKVAKIFSNFRKDKELKDISFDTKKELYEENKGSTTLIIYIAIYLGIIFLISSAAVLALQQLSEASDSIERYNILKKIGTPKKMINKAILVQVFIYFSIPLVLAVVHSIVGMNVINNFLEMYGTNIGTGSLITLFILFVVYGGYFCVTYTGYKNIVK